MNHLKNGTLWADASGRPIQAHGGWILPVVEDDETVFYWYGEDKSGVTVNRRMDSIGIHCYRSSDLVTWDDCGLVFESDAESAVDALRPSGVMERPRVLYNAKTGKYVLWFHADDAKYRFAGVGIAVSDSPTGRFELVDVIKPCNQDSRDFTLFEQEDGRAYLICSSEGNKTLHVAPLTPDYQGVSGGYARAFPEQEREAPCAFAAHGQFYLLTSGCTGWRPNPALFGYAHDIIGPWKLIDNPCVGERARNTYDGQATCIFEAEGRLFVLIDHWHPCDLGSSAYSMLPISFLPIKHDPIEIAWCDRFAGLK